MGNLIRRAFNWVDQGNRPYIFILLLLAASSLLVYANPRALLAFLLLLSTPLLLYFTHTDRRFKVFVGLLLAVAVLPVVGIRNIFYLEVAFQISVFAALALGLNIVVGFAGLLDLGYIAFYAVGAYLWAIFGSRQLLLLYEVPGTAPATTTFPLGADWFWLFLFLGVGLAALTGILLGTPVLRLRGDYLAIVTLGFGEVIRVLANNLDKPINLTNGPQGITPIQRPPLPPPFITEPIRSVLSTLTGKATVTDADLYQLVFYFLALIIILIVIATSGGKPEKSSPGPAVKAPVVEAPRKPAVDVSLLEAEGKKKTDEGLKLIQPRLKADASAPKENVRGDLEKGLKLLNEGIAAYEEAGRRAGKSYPLADSQKTRARAIKTLCDDDLEKEGLSKCEEGMKLFHTTEAVMTAKTAASDDEKKKLREDLQKVVKLITEGMNLFDRSYQVSGHSFDTTRYGQTLKISRGKLLELK